MTVNDWALGILRSATYEQIGATLMLAHIPVRTADGTTRDVQLPVPMEVMEAAFPQPLVHRSGAQAKVTA
jgi:hypothetical protein